MAKRHQAREKRVFDLAAGGMLLILCLPLMAVTALVVLVLDGRPVLYVSTRMRTPRQGFSLLKFRTLTAGPGSAPIPAGRLLRRTRLDELPQLWNVLRGDMSLVGPRPPLPMQVARHPHLYTRILSETPGLTGLATLLLHRREDRIVHGCGRDATGLAALEARSLPWKARIEAIYARRRTLRLDILILAATLRSVCGAGGHPPMLPRVGRGDMVRRSLPERSETASTRPGTTCLPDWAEVKAEVRVATH